MKIVPTTALTPPEHYSIAFMAAMTVWEASLKRPDLQERDRVNAALLAYQRQLDALIITSWRTPDGDLEDASPVD